MSYNFVQLRGFGPTAFLYVTVDGVEYEVRSLKDFELLPINLIDAEVFCSSTLDFPEEFKLNAAMLEVVSKFRTPLR